MTLAFVIALLVFLGFLAWIYSNTLTEEEAQAELDAIVIRRLEDDGP